MRDIEIVVQLARAGEGVGGGDHPLDVIERVLYSEEGNSSSLQIKEGTDGKYHFYST